MALLILGLILWIFPHLFKRLAPAARARMGDRAKIIVALTSVAAIVLMVVGYRNAPSSPIWSLPASVVYVNNVLMFIAVYLFVASGAKTKITARMQHPQLMAVMIWAVAHLLVNGDTASLILFGSLFVWAVAEIAMINRTESEWHPEKGWPLRGEAAPLAASVVVFILIAAIPGWVGPSPFAV